MEIASCEGLRGGLNQALGSMADRRGFGGVEIGT